VREWADSWKGSVLGAAAAFLASAVVFAAMAAAVPLGGETVLVVLWCLLWAGGVGFAAHRLGPVYGVPLALAAALAMDSFYILPTRSFTADDWQNYLVTAMYILVGVFVGVILEAAQGRADSSETARGELGEEQDALRRVATLVAQGVPAEELFAAVATEVARAVPDADLTTIGRYDCGDAIEFVGGWSKEGTPDFARQRVGLGGQNIATLVFETGEPARLDDLPRQAAAGSSSSRASARSSAGAPICVDGRLWGVVTVGSPRRDALPAGTERRLADFSDLLVTAIANAEARAELTASRARVVATAEDTRRKIERDLHDGVQQRLVSLALQLRTAERRVATDQPQVRAVLSAAVDALNDATEEVREIAHGIHPAILIQGGLAPAVRALGRQSSLAIEVTADFEERLPEQVEATAYYVVAEALTNVAKHATASRVSVAVERNVGQLRVLISDDGVGGADPAEGSGLTGLRDRAEALGGSFDVRSSRGQGTSLEMALPLLAAAGSSDFSG
jgi:signal transduction histidine kinase